MSSEYRNKLGQCSENERISWLVGELSLLLLNCCASNVFKLRIGEMSLRVCAVRMLHMSVKRCGKKEEKVYSKTEVY